jgi:NlpC/P60 family
MVAQAEWAISNAGAIHYPKIDDFQHARPMPIHIPVHHLPFTTDCSGFVTLMAKWGGAPDPNGRGYDGYGFTGTLLDNLQHTDRQHAKRGDLVVYGGQNGEHVVMLLQNVANHPDPLVVSHGEESGPSRYLLSTETAFFHAGIQMRFLRMLFDCQHHEATGDVSLDTLVDQLHTSVQSVVHATRNSHLYGKGFYGISAVNLAKFMEYVHGGADQKMPQGLVYYTIQDG